MNNTGLRSSCVDTNQAELLALLAAGTGPQQLAEILNTLPANALLRVFHTPVFNLITEVGVTKSFSMPLVAGKIFLPFPRLSLNLLTRDAALTTPPGIAISQNAVDLTATNLGPTASQCNNRTPPAIFDFPINMNTVDMTTFSLDLRLTTAAAGAGLTACTGRFMMFGVYF